MGFKIEGKWTITEFDQLVPISLQIIEVGRPLLSGISYNIIRDKMVRILSDEEIKSVVEEYNNGGTTTTLGEKYNVSAVAINGLLKRRNVLLRPPGFHRNYDVNEGYFNEIDAEDKAYWLGFIAADGNIHQRSYLRVRLAAKDKQQLENFKKAISSQHPIREYKTNQGHPACRLIIGSRKIVDALSNYSIVPNKRHILEFPDIPGELVRHYIRGYFDGDGSISNINQTLEFSIATGSMPFILDLQERLSRACNLNKTKLKQRHHNTWAVSYTGNRQCRRIYDYLYANSGIWLDRKRIKFEGSE